MELRSREQFEIFNWVILLLSVILAGIHLFLGNFIEGVPDERQGPFAIIGLVFLVGSIIYLTSYWRPVFYVLGVGLVVYLGGLWVLAGMEFLRIGLLTGLVATTFGTLALYLFVKEETHFETEKDH